jgi:2-oxoglutarate/2-oxoacid ferredoxin oxidoreductase subunit beta
MNQIQQPLAGYIRPGAEMTPMCAGCGSGIVAHGVLRAIDRMKIDMDQIVFVSGIGCAGWIPSPFFNADVLHTMPGKAVAVATGVKLSRPDLKVVVISGDGDLMSLGGNHLIHAARRGVGIAVICFNNGVYEMNAGQTTPGVKQKMPIYGELAPPFDMCDLMRASGASYVARWTIYQAKQISASVEKALASPGFAFIETVSFCCTHAGPRIGSRGAVEMMQIYRDRSVPLEEVRPLGITSLRGRWVVGEFVNPGGAATAESAGAPEMAISPT